MPSREPAKHSLTRLTPAPLPQAPLDAAQRLACLRLIRSDNVGPVTFRELINQFGGAVEALDALPELSRRGGRASHAHLPARRSRGRAGSSRAHRRPPAVHDRARLSACPGGAARAAAAALRRRARPAILLRPMLAIVGARNGSAAGQKLARLFAARIGAAGFVIASGLARGIDAAAHEAALATGTVAVVAGGLDVVYPPEHAAAAGRDRRAGLPRQRAAAGLRAARPGLPPPQPHHLRRLARRGRSSRRRAVPER